MHSYRSLITVAAMAGVLVLMAGVLLNTEHMARREKADPPAAGGAWVPLGSRSRARTNAAFETSFAELRRLVACIGPEGPGPELRAAMARARSQADAGTFLTIVASLEEPGCDARLLPYGLALIGAGRAAGAVPYLERRYRSDRAAALEALTDHGGDDARAALLRIAAAESESAFSERARALAARLDPAAPR